MSIILKLKGSTRHACSCAMLLTALMLFTGQEVSAQHSANGTVNPYSHIGVKIGVATYPLGHFDRDHSMTKLQAILAGMKQTMSNGGGTSYQKLKYDYCNAVYAHISTHYVAPEIALLTNLSGLNGRRSTLGISNNQLAALYNEVIVQIQ